jgi:hypothetical protein
MMHVVKLANNNSQWDISLNLWDRLMHAGTVQNLPSFVEAGLIAACELWKLCNDKVPKA